MTEWVKKKETPEADALEVRGKQIPKPIVQVLKNRGYDTAEQVEKFFDPSLENLHDPFLMTDMEKAADRIIAAINKKEKVLIHGDYDTDGISSVALLYRNLKKLELDAEYYIPNRFSDGYGVAKAGIDHAADRGCSLVITVDCGITAIDEINHAAEKNLEVIVCDHHLPKEQVPNAYALLNPKLPGSNYPFKDLAGVGVAFKLAQAICEKLHIAREEIFSDLDLVALGTVVDIVPLVDENRCLVRHGIKRILKSKKTGFRALLRETRLESGLSSYHLGFIIGPRINACGRLRDARDALEMFLTDDMALAVKWAAELSRDNQERQGIEMDILADAFGMIKKMGMENDRVIVLGSEEWHEGIIGIVASKIVDEFGKPTVLFAVKEETAKGSGRSVAGFDLADALNKCREVLLKFGGHRQAAGMELLKGNIPELRKRINDYALLMDAAVFTKRYFYDLKLSLADLTDEVFHFLKYFEPTGTANPQPVFLGEDFEVVGVPRVVGERHLRFAFRNNGVVQQAIAYDQAQNILEIVPGRTRVDCLYTVSEDSLVKEMKQQSKIMLKVLDMKKCGS
jgi:single-stranded-DNA-specific exonuclease